MTRKHGALWPPTVLAPCLPKASLPLPCRPFFSCYALIPWSQIPPCADGSWANVGHVHVSHPSPQALLPRDLPLPWQERGSTSPPRESGLALVTPCHQ